MVDPIVSTIDKTVNHIADVRVCLIGLKNEHITERIEPVMGGSIILVQVGANNVVRETNRDLVNKNRQVVMAMKEERVSQAVGSGV
jgi:hypothetical protein